MFNYLVGIYDEANVPHTEIPNLDEMTYEDLLSLEEKIGYVNKGFTKEQITVSHALLYNSSIENPIEKIPQRP